MSVPDPERPTNWPAIIWSTGAIGTAIAAMALNSVPAGLASIALAVCAAALIVHDAITRSN
jgi:uncharacterized membrane protein